MKNRLIVIVLTAILALSACNLRSAPIASPTPINADQGQPVGVTPSPTDTPELQPSNTVMPLATITPTITPTRTPSAAMVTPKSEAVNCRFGPGTTYLAIGGLKTGASVPILGRNGDGTWWQIQNPNNVSENCWVSSLATNTTGNVAAVPMAAAPQPFVTLVTVNTPATISAPACPGSIPPIDFTGTIDVNGPVTVTYHFQTEQGGILPDHTLVFTQFGPLNVSDNSYTPPLAAGTYWVKLFVTAPNSLTAQASYTITCP